MRDIFNYKRFDDLIDSPNYLKAYPFPFMIFDDLFDVTKLDQINEEILTSDFKKDIRNIAGEEVKTRSDFKNFDDIPQNMFDIFSVMNGGKFLRYLSKLTSIDGLISDPYFEGGGVNEISKSGTLAIHVDGTTHNTTKLHRRLNAILYLNKDWDDNWGGHHEQWIPKFNYLDCFDKKQEWECVRLIRPKFNRLMIFTTNDFSWHGHTKPLKLPRGISRKSLITYYYTKDRPETDLRYKNPHRALFINNSISLKKKSFKDIPIV